LAFAIALAVIVTYLVAVNRGFDPGLSVFWLSILLLSAVPIYQLSQSDVVTESWEKIILIEIFLMTLAVRLIWVVPFSSSLREVDPHYDYYAAKLILNYGLSKSLELPLLEQTRSYLEWPMLHILTAMASDTLGINLLELAKWFPLMYGPFSLPLFYLFAKATCNDARVGLLASYALSALYMYASWDSMFVRESLATGIFWFLLYVSLKAGRTRRRGFVILAFIGAVSLVFCHHLTSVMLILFGLVALAVGGLSRTRQVRYFFRGLERSEQRWTYLPILFVLLAMVIMIAQWAYMGYWMLGWVTSIARDLASSKYGGTYAFELMSPRIAISLYGNALFLFVAGCILLYHVRRHACTNAISDFDLGIWGFFVVGVCLLITRIQALAAYIDVTRLQKFGWPFILIVTAHAAVRMKRRKVYLVLFTMFVILQVFTIPPNFYTRSIGPDYASGRVRGYYLAEEYAAVDWFNSSDRVVGDLAVHELLGGLKQVPVDDAGRFLKDGQLYLPLGYLLFYRMEDSQNMQSFESSVEITRVVTVRPEALDIVANRYYDNAQVIIYGFN
jgi:hypothetical protein